MEDTMDPASMHAGSTYAVHSIKACVVYDEASGQIQHHHSVVTLVGGKEPEEHEIARDALAAHNNQRSRAALKMRVLHVAPDALKSGQRYRVHHGQQALIREE
jgi:hypothetical protein